MEPFRAYRIFEEAGKAHGRIVDMTLAELDPGEVVIKSAYSSVNFKDALSGTGNGKIVRRFPCVGGIDGCGTVVSSSDHRYKEGDEILCTGYDMGSAHDGGYAGMLRLPADWIVPLPRSLSLFEAMSVGTAGYTAALAIHLLEHNAMAPGNGKVVVNGATGGCASIVIDMLARLGYEVTAVTGKIGEAEYLKKLGASEVLGREALGPSAKPLEKAQWAAAFDSVGGEQLAALTRTMQPDGVIASFGNAGGIELHTTVLPFILRGIQLIGVNSVSTPLPLRRAVWERIATDLKPRHLNDIVHTITLDELNATFERMLKGSTRGRTVVETS